jgi:putative endonuclease
MRTHIYFVYIMTNPSRSVFYVGITNSLRRRTQEHRDGADNRSTSFCGRYNCKHLVYSETFQWVQEAISREKQVKKFSRAKKLLLIRSVNQELRFMETDEL